MLLYAIMFVLFIFFFLFGYTVLVFNVTMINIQKVERKDIAGI
jgi:hypothetical protein